MSLTNQRAALRVLTKASIKINIDQSEASIESIDQSQDSPDPCYVPGPPGVSGHLPHRGRGVRTACDEHSPVPDQSEESIENIDQSEASITLANEKNSVDQSEVRTHLSMATAVTMSVCLTLLATSFAFRRLKHETTNQKRVFVASTNQRPLYRESTS